LDAGVFGGPEHVSGAVDRGIADALVVPERERRGGVNDRIRARLFERRTDGVLVADIALDELDALDLVFGFERFEVERRDVPTPLFEVFTRVQPEESGAASDEERPRFVESFVRSVWCLHCVPILDAV